MHISERAVQIYEQLFSAKLFRAQLSYFEDIDFSEPLDFIVPEPSESEIKQFKPIYADLVKSRKKLVETIEETKDSLDSFGDDSNENLTQNIIGSLVSPLLSIS